MCVGSYPKVDMNAYIHAGLGTAWKFQIPLRFNSGEAGSTVKTVIVETLHYYYCTNNMLIQYFNLYNLIYNKFR